MSDSNPPGQEVADVVESARRSDDLQGPSSAYASASRLFDRITELVAPQQPGNPGEESGQIRGSPPVMW